VWVVREEGKVAEARVDLEDDVAAVPPVAAVRAAPRRVRLAEDRDGPIAAPTAAHEHRHLVDERHAVIVAEPGSDRRPVRRRCEKMWAMPETTRVWAVELTKGDPSREIEGRLSLDAQDLRFEPAAEGRPTLTLPLDRIAQVRRLRGSPVLMVVCQQPEREIRTAFYFVQPPPLAAFTEPVSESRIPMPTLRNPKRKARRDNVGYLGLMNREKKAELVEWVRAVRAAVASARGVSEG